MLDTARASWPAALDVRGAAETGVRASSPVMPCLLCQVERIVVCRRQGRGCRLHGLLRGCHLHGRHLPWLVGRWLRRWRCRRGRRPRWLLCCRLLGCRRLPWLVGRWLWRWRCRRGRRLRWLLCWRRLGCRRRRRRWLLLLLDGPMRRRGCWQLVSVMLLEVSVLLELRAELTLCRFARLVCCRFTGHRKGSTWCPWLGAEHPPCVTAN
jgi:hypothetical protein